MGMLPILEDVALARVTVWVGKNSNDLTVDCLARLRNSNLATNGQVMVRPPAAHT